MKKKLNILVLFFFFTISCEESKTDSFQNKNSVNSEWKVQQHLDTTRLKENKELELLLKTIVKGLKVEKNHLTFTLTREEFFKLGLSEKYYDRLVIDLGFANNLIDSLGIDAETMLKESYRDLYIKFDSSEAK
jgi:ABC-type Fe3+-citrate transport system substrate-binding protein